MRTLLLSLVIALLVVACARPSAKTEVPGTYEFAADGRKQVVVVASDGQYTNTVYEGDRELWSDRSVWTYEQQANKPGVTFTAFRFGIPGHSAEAGFWFVVPTKTVGGTKQLCFDADLGRCFQSKG